MKKTIFAIIIAVCFVSCSPVKKVTPAPQTNDFDSAFSLKTDTTASLPLIRSGAIPDTIIYGIGFYKTSSQHYLLNSDSTAVAIISRKTSDVVPCYEYQYKLLWFTLTKKSNFIYRVRDSKTRIVTHFLNDQFQKINNLLQYRNQEGWVWVGEGVKYK